MSIQTQTGFPGSPGSPLPVIFGSTTPKQESCNYWDEATSGLLVAGWPQRTECNRYVLILSGSPKTQIPAAHTLQGGAVYGGILSYSALSSTPLKYLVGYTLQAQPAASSYVLEEEPFNVQWVPAGAQGNANDEVKSATKALFNLADLVDFEDGVENEFTTQLSSLVKKYGSVALETLAKTLFLAEIHTEVAAQALLCLGRIDDGPSYLARSWVLQRGLFSASAKVRDAAAVGISSLADVRAKDSLEAAIGKEPIRDLKEDMQEVLSYLQTVK